LRLLFIGDVIGKPGRRALTALVPGLRREYSLDMVVANGENSAGGLGITPEIVEEFLALGVDVITTGNHIWAQKDIIPYLDSNAPVIRPLNFPPGVPGRGSFLFRDTLVINLIGRTYIDSYDCPFRAMDSLLSSLQPKPRVIMVDFHAEATSEKVAMGRYLDGRVSAVFGTHTHVGTIDTMILPKGTAYVTDVGMVGPDDSVIGDDIDSVLRSFLKKTPHRLSVGKGSVTFNAIMVEVDNA
jgi:2',3'-cyclic-nucleotide 2'-phosphodiesterase